ncbi:MAG: hypothetical protein PPFGHCPK_00498 [Spiroplasma endosymbiont of Drosophila atripex]|nr:MAG: hypothetical protein PPFGHCPK_00498 [Spiroplasma endosymbiont of Drosophila atripex]
MIRQERISEDSRQQLIYNYQGLNIWEKVGIIGSGFLLSTIPGIGITYLCNEKIVKALGSNENKFSLPIRMLIGAATSSLLVLFIMGPFVHKKLFPEWYEKRAEARYINKTISEIENLRNDFVNINNNWNENSTVSLMEILTKLNNKKEELQNKEKPLMFHWELERMVDNLIIDVNNQLIRFDPISIRAINDMLDNWDNNSELNGSSQSLICY